jgi:glycosyltransferase involved in cell wall biosynthesis
MTATAVLRRREYEVAQVDVYSGRSFLWAEAAACALRACGKPFALTLHGGELPRFAEANPGRARRLLGWAAAVTAPSPYLRKAFEGFGRRIQLIPNAVDLPRYPFRLRENPRPRLIWLRAFHDVYNSILAVETLAALKKDLAGASLTMIGPDRGDGSFERCRARSEQLALADRVRLQGRVAKSAVPWRLAAAEIFINTSRSDNTPVSLIEAMACGLPIVTPAVGGIPDLLVNERDALLTPPGDARALARAIVRICREPGLGARLSLNARRKAEGFGWDSVLPAWQQLLGELAAR